MARPHLQRLRPGQPLTAQHYNALCDAIEQNWVDVPEAGPLSVVRGAGGVVLSLVMPWLVVLGKTSTSVAARSGTTVSSGTADIYRLASTTLTAYTGSRTVYNLLNKTIASGSYVIAVRIWKDYWVVAVDDCTHLS